MKWIKQWSLLPRHTRFSSDISKLGLRFQTTDKYQYDIYNGEKCVDHKYYDKQIQSRLSLLPSPQFGIAGGNLRFREGPLLVNKALKGSELLSHIRGEMLEQVPLTILRHFGQAAKREPALSRDRLVQLWLAEKKRKHPRRTAKRISFQHVQNRNTGLGNLSSFQMPYSRRSFIRGPAQEKISANVAKPPLEQPPLSQSATGSLKPTSPEEVRIAPLLCRSNLLITRDIEWVNLMLGFEQENRYAIVDAAYPQSPVGFIREQSNFIYRQLLRTRRPFIAYITDATGSELFRIRRPVWFINSTIYAEVDGKEIGVVHRRWHLWRRVYDLYLGKKQFAVVENPGFWNWTFTLKDNDGNVLAEINRDWRGIGFELLTDAGQYVIRFGDVDHHSKTGLAGAIQELAISRPLTLSERAVAVALAVSLDNDYFSTHGGWYWGVPFIAVGE